MYHTLFTTHYDDSEGDPKGDPKEPEKTFNQTQLNEIVEKRVAKMKSENRQMLSKFESLQGSLKTDNEGREALEIELDELRQRTLTQDEIQKREAKKAADKYTTDLEAAQSDAKTWKGEYNDLRISYEIKGASAHSKVLPESFELVEAFLRPNTKMIEVRDDEGVTTGKTQTMVDFSDVDSEGKPIIAQMTVPDTLKRMSELPEKYGNLFEGKKISGTGRTSGGSGPTGKLDPSKMDTDTYIKFRKENPDAALDSI